MEKKLSAAGEGSFSVKVSDSGEFYLLENEGDGSYLNTPSYTLYKWEGGGGNGGGKGKEVEVVEENLFLSSQLRLLNLPSKSFFTLPSPSSPSLSLNSLLLLPPNFDKNKKYRNSLFFFFFNFFYFNFLIQFFFFFFENVEGLVVVKGRPFSQQVFKKFSLGFEDYLASQGMVVCMVDGRGIFFFFFFTHFFFLKFFFTHFFFF